MCLGLAESVWQTVQQWGKKILYVIFSRIKKLTMNSPAMSRSQYPKEKNKTQKCMTKPDESQRADKLQYKTGTSLVKADDGFIVLQ